MRPGCSFPALLLVALLTGTIEGGAQVPVSSEPRHHNVFENPWVRVLDVRVAPGDTTLMHKHSTPSVFIVLSQTKTGSQVLVEPARANFSDPHIWFEGFYGKPRIHRVWNSDTTEFHVVDMEILNKDPQPLDSPIRLKDFALLFDEKPVRGYRVTLPPGEFLPAMHRTAPIIVIRLGNAAGDVTAAGKSLVRSGDFVFVGPGQPLGFRNDGSNVEDVAVFELK